MHHLLMSTHGASSHIHFERNCLVVGLYSKGVVFSFLEIGVKGKQTIPQSFATCPLCMMPYVANKTELKLLLSYASAT